MGESSVSGHGLGFSTVFRLPLNPLRLSVGDWCLEIAGLDFGSGLILGDLSILPMGQVAETPGFIHILENSGQLICGVTCGVATGLL